MKHSFALIGLLVVCNACLAEEEALPNDNLAKHAEESAQVADDQDELSADVQQLVVEQTIPKVIELLTQVEDIMDEATEKLAEADTGGETIAAQTEIIEKILAAAKEKQSSGKGSCSKAGGAMMDMMERMAGKKPEGEKEGKGGEKNGKAGEEGGKGQTGDSDTANKAVGGQASGKSEARRVPKAGGAASLEIPEEFKKAFDAYNRGAEQKVK